MQYIALIDTKKINFKCRQNVSLKMMEITHFGKYEVTVEKYSK